MLTMFQLVPIYICIEINKMCRKDNITCHLRQASYTYFVVDRYEKTLDVTRREHLRIGNRHQLVRRWVPTYCEFILRQ